MKALATNKQSADDLNKNLQYLLQIDRTKYQLPGLSVSLKLPGEMGIKNFVSGYYSYLDNRTITPDTLFQIGSITKLFTATLIFKLVEDNKIKLNQSITQWLPQYPRWKNITIKDLLRHTSGVANYTHGKEFDKLLRQNQNKYFSLADMANLAYSHIDLFKPGQKYNYTNTDYILLGMIIEKVMKQPLQQIFDRYLLEQHLFNTFYISHTYPQKVMNRIAHGYNRDGTFKFNQDVTFVSLSFAQTSGAIVSTPNDLIKWLHQLFTGKVISNESLANMMIVNSEITAKPIAIPNLQLLSKTSSSNLFDEIGSGIGMGLIYFKDNNTLAWTHAGGMPGYEAFYLYDHCKDIYLVVMYNLKPKQQFIFMAIANDILNRINKSLLVEEHIADFQRTHTLPAYCKVTQLP